MRSITPTTFVQFFENSEIDTFLAKLRPPSLSLSYRYRQNNFMFLGVSQNMGGGGNADGKHTPEGILLPKYVFYRLFVFIDIFLQEFDSHRLQYQANLYFQKTVLEGKVFGIRDN